MSSSSSPPSGPPPSPPASGPAAAWLIFGGLLLWSFSLHYRAGDNAQWLRDLGLLLLPEELLRRWTMGVADGPLDFRRAGVADRLGPLALAASWLAASWGAGAWLLSRLSWHQTVTRPERRLLETAVGLGASSLAVLALGLAGGLSAWPMRLLAAAGLAAGLWSRRHGLADCAADCAADAGTPAGTPAAPDARAAAPAASPWPRLAAWASLPLLGLMTLAALMPPFEFDVMEYHLQVPKEWRQAGRITFLPHNVYGNMPLGAEMHPLAAMTLDGSPDGWFHGALAGKLVMACFAPLAALGLWTAGRRWLSPAAGALAAFLFLTTPWVFKISTIGHNEVVIGAYGLFAFYAVLRWTELVRESGPRPAGQGSGGGGKAPAAGPPLSAEQRRAAARSWLLVAGWLLGAAAACKYTAVAFLAFPLWMAVLCWGGRLRWRPALLVLAAAVAAGGLWYAKNAAATGNPVYPLAYRLFGGRGWDEQKAERWRRAHFAKGHGLGQLAESVSGIAWRAPDQSFALPALMLLALLPLGWRRDRRAILLRRWLVLLMLYVFVVWWGVTHRLERFLVPLAPLAALLAGGAAAQLDRQRRGAVWTRYALGAVLAAVWLLAMLAPAAGRLGEFRYLMKLDALRYDRSLVRVHPAHLMLNTAGIVPPGKRVLLVAEAQVFNFEVPILYSTCFDDTPLKPLVRGRTAGQRRRAFREAGISHVFVHWGELRRYRQPGNYGFPEFVTPELFAELQQQGVLKEIPIVAPSGDVDASSSLFEVQ